MNRPIAAIALLLLAAAGLAAQEKVARTESERLGAEKFNQAIQAYSEENYQQAIPLFLAADTLIGESGLVDRVKLRFALGSSFLETGMPEQAMSYFQWVEEQDSAYPFIHLQLAEGARAAGRRGEALSYYRRALPKHKPQQQAAILGRIAELELKAGDIQAALQAVDRAISITPASSFYLMRGQIYDRMAQRLDHAQDRDYDYERAIREGEVTVELMQRATELREKALEDYRSAARDDRLAETTSRLIERSEVIIENNGHVISEIRYLEEEESEG